MYKWEMQYAFFLTHSRSFLNIKTEINIYALKASVMCHIFKVYNLNIRSEKLKGTKFWKYKLDIFEINKQLFLILKNIFNQTVQWCMAKICTVKPIRMKFSLQKFNPAELNRFDFLKQNFDLDILNMVFVELAN